MSCNKYTGEGTLTTTLFLLYKETMIENTPKLKDPMWQHPYLLILSLWPNILWENFLNSKPCCLCLPSAVQTAVMWVQEQHICRLYHFDMRRAWIFHVWRCLNLFWRQVDRKKKKRTLSLPSHCFAVFCFCLQDSFNIQTRFKNHFWMYNLCVPERQEEKKVNY